MNKYAMKSALWAAVAIATVTMGRNALACGGACPGGDEEDYTDNFYYYTPPQGGNGYWEAPPWKNYNSGDWDPSGVFFQTGFDSANNAGWFTIQPFESNVSCAEASGWQDGQEVSGCYAQCDTGNFGDGGNCTTITFEDGSCTNTDTGFGPPSNFALDVIQCISG